MGLCDYGLGSQPTDTPKEINIGAVTCMVARSRLALYPGNRDLIVPGYETSESGTPLKGNLEERIEVLGVSLKRRSTYQQLHYT